jgi:hypothetical protein
MPAEPGAIASPLKVIILSVFMSREEVLFLRDRERVLCQ